MLYWTNGCARMGCPKELVAVLRELNEQEEVIKDVQLTENRSWLILYGRNGLRWYNIPYDLEDKIREYNKNNDYSDWIVISEEIYYSSHPNIQNWLEEGIKNMDTYVPRVLPTMPWLSTRADIAFPGTQKISKTALKETNIDAYHKKIAGNSWFFADKNGIYYYLM